MVNRLNEREGSLVYVIDDEAEHRRALVELIGMIGVEVRAYGRPSEFLDDIDHGRTACAVIDMRLPEMSGIELLGHLGGIPSIIVTGHSDVPTAVRALKAGAVDFIEKPVHPQQLIDAIQNQLDDATRQAERRAAANRLRDALHRLSQRQREILPHVVAGQSAKEIARELDLSPRTVEKHRAALMEKLGVNSTGAIIRLTVQAVAVDPDILSDSMLEGR